MHRSPTGFVALVFALSIPIWLIEPREWPITAAVGVPLLAAVILVCREEGVAGVRRLFGRALDYRKIEKKIWYVPTLLLTPLLSVLAYGIMRLIGLPLRSEPYNLLPMIPFFAPLFLTLAVGEEVGWTGYLLDPIQQRWSALTCALIIGLVTSLWHVWPLINMRRTPTWITWWAVWSVPLRIFFVWLYNNAGKSVFAAIAFHAMVNLSNSSPFIPRHGSAWDLAVVGVLTVIAAVTVTVLWGPRTLAAYRYGGVVADETS